LATFETPAAGVANEREAKISRRKRQAGSATVTHEGSWWSPLRLPWALPYVLERGELVGMTSAEDKGSNVKAFHFLRATVSLEGRHVTVTVSVREYNNGDLYKALRPPTPPRTRTVCAKQGPERRRAKASPKIWARMA